MNNIDRNQAIGLVLISAMLIAYFTFFSGTNDKPQDVSQNKIEISADSIKKIEETIAKVDSAQSKIAYGSFSDYIAQSETETVLENQNLKIIFSSKGGKIKNVVLKNYKTYTKEELVLINNQFSKQSLIVNKNDQAIDLYNLAFTPQLEGNKLTYILQTADNQKIIQTYQLLGDKFELTYDLQFEGLSSQFQGSNATFNWSLAQPLTEKDLVASRNTSNITYRLLDGTYNSFSEAKLETQESSLETKINWVTLKSKFFSTAIIAENGFTKGTLKSEVNVNDPSVVKSFETKLDISLKDINEGKGKFKYFFGPNKLSIVGDVAPSFNENVYLGWPVINTINRYTIAPLFGVLEKVFSNYGLIIILIVLIIKAVLFPLSFQSYKSMAKIKVLKPELDEIKARHGDDMGAVQQEQMKLYQQVGINPLSGCIPVLLQMPVLLAMFNFFPNAIELRQQPFLWAEDLSTFDSIATLPFSIPFYGDHVSLFTLLMTASTILYTWYNNQINVSATGPMVAMSYFMPLIFMFVLNSMPAGLGFYYFVSNMVTIGQQYIIKAFVDEKAIRAKLDDNKKNSGTKKPNRFQQRLMEAMEQQKELKKKSAKK